MTTLISSWSPELWKHIPNAPTPAIINAVRTACQRFCTETHIWTRVLDLIDVVDGATDYALHIPDGTDGEDDLNAELVGLAENGVKYKDADADNDEFGYLHITSEEDLDSSFPSWRYWDEGTPAHCYMDNLDKELHLVPEPEDDSDEGLEVKVVLRPDDTCTTVPDFLYKDFKKVVVYGALSELFSDAGSPWYDNEKFAANEAMFISGYSNARQKKFTGPTNSRQTIKMGFFA